MNEEEWLAGNDPQSMLANISDARKHRRKLRLFGCAACRRVWTWMTDVRCTAAVEASERFADGGIPERELSLLSGAAQEAFLEAFATPDGPGSIASRVAHAACYVSDSALHRVILAEAVAAAADARADNLPEERAAQAALLRDIFGNPFRKVKFNGKWRTDTATTLARQMYTAREFGAMPILADALQDAGCDHTDLLDHCRDPKQVHVRGCWVVDLVLGKE